MTLSVQDRAPVETAISAASWWRSAEFRRRALVTLAILVVFRAGLSLPVSGIDPARVAELIGGEGGFWGAVMSPGALDRVSVLALGIAPFVVALAWFELLRIAVPPLRRWIASDAGGRAFCLRLVLAAAVTIAFLQAVAVARAMEQISGLVIEPGLEFRIGAVTALTGGAVVSIALAMAIDRYGLGNGIWILFAAGLVHYVPQTILGLRQLAMGGEIGAGLIWSVAIFYAVALVLLVAIERGMFGTGSGGRAGPVNPGGVWPIVIAGNVAFGLLYGLIVAVSFVAPDSVNAGWLSPYSWPISILTALAILLACFLYARAAAEEAGEAPDTARAAARSLIPSAVLLAIWFGGRQLILVYDAPILIEGSALVILVITLARLARAPTGRHAPPAAQR